MPIAISPERPVFFAVSANELGKGTPGCEHRVITGIVYVIPANEPREFTVKVNGFPEAPGGMLESERLTPGHSVDEITLTTPQDPDLHSELGVSAVCIDQVLYQAVNPGHAEITGSDTI